MLHWSTSIKSTNKRKKIIDSGEPSVSTNRVVIGPGNWSPGATNVVLVVTAFHFPMLCRFLTDLNETYHTY